MAQHLALFIPSLAGGGVARSLLTLAGALAKRGFRVDLVLSRAEGAFRDQVPPLVNIVALQATPGWQGRLYALAADTGGVNALLRPVLLPRTISRTLRYLPGLVRYLRREQPVAMLSALTYPNLAALWARRLAGVSTRIVVSERTQLSRVVHDSRRWKWRFVPPLVGRSYLVADGITTVSQGVADDLVFSFGLPAERITTIYNPVVTPELYEKAQAPLDHPWFTPDAPPVLLGAGRLHDQKDFPTLLRAFARVRAVRAVRLLILGEGAQRAAVQQLVQELGVGADVEMPGFVRNPFAYMARAAVFVLSSQYEGFGNVLVEALACGCPVVSTDCPSGPAEILANGAYGPLVPVGDEEALARAMLAVLAHPPDAARLRQRAAEFSLDRAVDAYLKVLIGD